MTQKTKVLLVIIGFSLLTLFHFDFWWFHLVDPILFGFMPFALWFQILTGGIVASIFLYFSYKVIWPDVPDEFDEEVE
ncbi:hypothetical protein [Bacillus sp. B15-48]|uniref:hypothetical protein n=1 Tax=Bacillus sp. B15-48 TaxID=1548601 RepID=UPI00193FF858|nr:hypothetical protein [Bacillus sp. B15-48]MBM4764974.1 hypothetical protein [Bacillus sp. B15-48]